MRAIQPGSERKIWYYLVEYKAIEQTSWQPAVIVSTQCPALVAEFEDKASSPTTSPTTPRTTPAAIVSAQSPEIIAQFEATSSPQRDETPHTTNNQTDQVRQGVERQAVKEQSYSQDDGYNYQYHPHLLHHPYHLIRPFQILQLLNAFSTIGIIAILASLAFHPSPSLILTYSTIPHLLSHLSPFLSPQFITSASPLAKGDPKSE